MCATLTTCKGGSIATMEALRAHWGDPIIDPDYETDPPSPFKGGCCLCPVDVAATAAKYRKEVVQMESGDWLEIP